MNYLIGYLAVGIVVLLFAILQQRRQKNFASDFSKAVLENLHPERKHWRYRLLHEFIIPALTGLLMIVAWPIAIYIHFKLQRERQLADEEEFPEPPKFAVEKSHLLQLTSPLEIMAKEMVFDPKGAVPEFPFGHLNTAWLQFNDKLEFRDEVWTFSAPWRSESGQPEIRIGYAIVRNGTIPHHYVTRYG